MRVGEDESECVSAFDIDFGYRNEPSFHSNHSDSGFRYTYATAHVSTSTAATVTPMAKAATLRPDAAAEGAAVGIWRRRTQADEY
jgi:hypothetical protein